MVEMSDAVDAVSFRPSSYCSTTAIAKVLRRSITVGREEQQRMYIHGLSRTVDTLAVFSGKGGLTAAAICPKEEVHSWAPSSCGQWV